MAAEDRDLNRDPITDEPGAHPVGTGVGAVGGAVAGAAAGAIGGPIGLAVGGVVGAVIGGLAGKATAEAVNPTAEEEHWRENYTGEPYYEQGRSFDDYGPAYRYGVSGRTQHEGDWDSAEPRLASQWESNRDSSSLSWDDAKPATRAAWERIDSNQGDTMGDRAGGDAFAGSRMEMGTDTMSMSDGAANRMHMSGSGMTMGDTGTSGSAAMVGELQSAGDNSGDRDDVVDVLKDLVETCFDGEYGFKTSADQAKRQDIKSLLLQRAEDCRRGAQELTGKIQAMGGQVSEGGSAMGAIHRGWVAVRTTLSTYDDKAVLDECERGEDNALAHYRKALKKNLPADVKLVVERQLQGVQRNHDQVKMLRDQFKAQS